MANNIKLRAAGAAKNDEFYTRMEDIKKELQHYTEHFKDKVVYCNCDNPEQSGFWKFFHLEFGNLGLKKLVSSYYERDSVPSYVMEYTGGSDEDVTAGVRRELTQNGDFRSPECIELLKEADIVVSNPPFSLFREYVAQLIEYNKKFVILGNMNAVTYKEFFSLVKENKVWAGHHFNETMEFIMPDSYELKGKTYVDDEGKKHGFVPAICWYTNLGVRKYRKPLETTYEYAKKEEFYPNLYPKYDNYDAINVDKVAQIPMDYEPCWYKCPYNLGCEYACSEGKTDNALCENACNGVMGVPITFLDKYCPEQFEIIDVLNRYSDSDYFGVNEDVRRRRSHCCNINGKATYKRIVIRKRPNFCDNYTKKV